MNDGDIKFTEELRAQARHSAAIRYARALGAAQAALATIRLLAAAAENDRRLAGILRIVQRAEVDIVSLMKEPRE
jgi:hypothetical protein